MTPFEIKSKLIDQKGDFSWEEIEKDYNPFMINRTLSFDSQGCIYSNMMNQFNHIDKRMQFDFYYYGIPKNRRFSKWVKSDEVNPDISVIKEFYGINTIRAIEVLSILTDDQLVIIKKKMQIGGRK